MLSANLIYMLFTYCVFGLGTDILLSIISIFPGQLTQMFNATLLNHYGIQASDTILSMGISVLNLISFCSFMIGILFFIPLMDKKGRKFCCVYLRFYLSFLASLFLSIGAMMNAAEFYMLGTFFAGLSMPVRLVVLSVYVAECSPDKYRGLVIVCLAIRDVLAQLIMYTAGRSNVLGSDKWYIIPIISVFLSVLLFIATIRLPDSPKYLISRTSRAQVSNAIKFYHGKIDEQEVDEVINSIVLEKNLTVQERLSMKDVWRSGTLREALLIVLSYNIFVLMSPAITERAYTVLLHTSMGLTVDQSMTVNFLTVLILGWLRFLGSYSIEKFGRRFIVFVAAALTYSKVLIMFTAQLLAYFQGPSTFTKVMAIINELCTELSAGTGFNVLGSLLITELFPPSARVAMSQLEMIFMSISAMPMVISYPIINKIFAPAFYIPMMFIQPMLIYFLYEKFPETKQKTVYDIVRKLDEDVKSRGGSIISYDFGFARRIGPIMRKRSNSYYYPSEGTPLLFTDSELRPRSNTENSRVRISYGTRMLSPPPDYKQAI